MLITDMNFRTLTLKIRAEDEKEETLLKEWQDAASKQLFDFPESYNKHVRVTIDLYRCCPISSNERGIVKLNSSFHFTEVEIFDEDYKEEK